MKYPKSETLILNKEREERKEIFDCICKISTPRGFKLSPSSNFTLQVENGARIRIALGNIDNIAGLEVDRLMISKAQFFSPAEIECAKGLVRSHNAPRNVYIVTDYEPY